MRRRPGGAWALAMSLTTMVSATLTLAVLASPASAGVNAHTAATTTRYSASADGITATFSYSGQGITTSHVRLQITQKGKILYNQPVPRTGCVPVCAAGDAHPVKISDLSGDGTPDVVLTLFSGGADCCTIDDVYVPSAALQSYVVYTHNFGEPGAELRNIGPKGLPVFVSADPLFYCRFTDCAASGLPLDILEFDGGRFADITTSYPKLIAADAARWIRLYRRYTSDGAGLIAAYAADQYELGSSAQATARTVVQLQVKDGKLKASFVRALFAFLTAHHYG